jgi:hypothetical protein
MSSIRTLPDSFIDLPAAVDSARRFGMFGALREGRLASVTSQGAPRLAWRLRSASESSRIYYIDAATGANVPPPPQPPHVKLGDTKLVKKVKGLFH